MRIDLAQMRATIPVASSSPSLLAQWRVGTILQAVAVRDASSGQLFLDLGGSRHPARLASGDEAPANGEKLSLRVLRNSPVLALERVPEPQGRAIDSEQVSEALRKFVPRQTSPAQLLSNLALLARGAAGTKDLPQVVVQAADKLWQAIPTSASLREPLTLERALSRSGTFLEASLAKDDGTPAARAAVSTDLKTLMLQLAQTLREQGARPSAAFADTAPHAPLPTGGGPLTPLASVPATLALIDSPNQQMNELARQTDGALARITTAQVSNAAQDGPVQSMMIELPVRHEDRASVLRFRLERDGSRREQGSAESWAVEAALDLGNVGSLHARVTLDGYRVGVQLRADSPAIVQLINERIDELESMLSEAGLEVDRIVCRHGMPAGDAGQRLTRLLDVHA